MKKNSIISAVLTIIIVAVIGFALFIASPFGGHHPFGEGSTTSIANTGPSSCIYLGPQTESPGPFLFTYKYDSAIGCGINETSTFYLLPFILDIVIYLILLTGIFLIFNKFIFRVRK